MAKSNSNSNGLRQDQPECAHARWAGGGCPTQGWTRFVVITHSESGRSDMGMITPLADVNVRVPRPSRVTPNLHITHIRSPLTEDRRGRDPHLLLRTSLSVTMGLKAIGPDTSGPEPTPRLCALHPTALFVLRPSDSIPRRRAISTSGDPDDLRTSSDGRHLHKTVEGNPPRHAVSCRSRRENNAFPRNARLRGSLLVTVTGQGTKSTGVDIDRRLDKAYRAAGGRGVIPRVARVVGPGVGRATGIRTARG